MDGTPVEDLLTDYLFGGCSIEEFAHGLHEIDAPDHELLLLAGVRGGLERLGAGEVTRSEMDTGLIRLVQAVHARNEQGSDSEH